MIVFLGRCKMDFKKVKAAIKPYLKPTMFVSFIIAWFLTNGWAYVVLGLGMHYNIVWAKVVATTYLGVLWLPFTPEKLITIPLTVLIQKLLFKNRGNTDESKSK